MFVTWHSWRCCFVISFAVLCHLSSSFLCSLLWDFFTFCLAFLSLALGCPFLWASFSFRAFGRDLIITFLSSFRAFGRDLIITFLSSFGALHRRSFFTPFGLTLLGHPLEVCLW